MRLSTLTSCGLTIAAAIILMVCTSTTVSADNSVGNTVTSDTPAAEQNPLVLQSSPPPVVGPITSACEFETPSGVRFDNLNLLRQFYWDYTWSGQDVDGDDTQWVIGVNVCHESASNTACRDQLGAVCIYNQTSINAHPRNETWPTDLMVAGLTNAIPAPRFDMLDPLNEAAGVLLSYNNAPFGSVVSVSIELRCDKRFLTADVVGATWSPRARTLAFVMASVYACPTSYPPKPFHMPDWGIALIVIASLIAVYVLVGCMYNCMCGGMPAGCASFPHKRLWLAGPRAIYGYIRRMWIYTLNGCKPEAEVYTEL